MAIFEAETWAAVPFWFWALTLSLLGAAIGSFLNVCIHRMPRGESLISPPSHCPACGYVIPWYLNLPLFTWFYLRGKCANCGVRISPRYFLVELLTAATFLGLWFYVGEEKPAVAVIYCLFAAGLITATFIDFEHFIIPDEITLGGTVVGFICSFLVPQLHGVDNAVLSLKESVLGIAVGAGAVYGVLRVGKLMFGRQNVQLAPSTRVIFTETAVVMPDRTIPYEDVFYRKSDTIVLDAETVELVDRCYKSVSVRLSPEKLRIGDEVLDPEQTPHMEVVTGKMVFPREAMGFGDVKFMAAIGAFLGWKAVVFTLMASSIIGAAVGLLLIVIGKQAWSGRLPYGPYIALAAMIWIFGGYRLVDWWLMMRVT